MSNIQNILKAATDSSFKNQGKNMDNEITIKNLQQQLLSFQDTEKHVNKSSSIETPQETTTAAKNSLHLKNRIF